MENNKMGKVINLVDCKRNYVLKMDKSELYKTYEYEDFKAAIIKNTKYINKNLKEISNNKPSEIANLIRLFYQFNQCHGEVLNVNLKELQKLMYKYETEIIKLIEILQKKYNSTLKIAE